MNKHLQLITFYLLFITLPLLVASCARMGQPDGGWYDEKPPYVVSSIPADKGTDVTSKKIKITFNEFIKIDNASENVLVSPPQHEQPEIKATGKNIIVELQDTLIPNTTYTVDFSDAITDNNESNPLGNYTYTFSTGKTIDTLEVSGYVLEAENLEPIKGIYVGLYAPGDSVMKRISRSDSRGKFVIRGIAPGTYTIGALQDQDNDYKFSQKSEKMAFSKREITPTCRPDKRQDTLWVDEHHIKDIKVQGYTHFFPDDIALRAFTHVTTDRYFLKADREEANHFTLYFTAPTPDKALPEVKLLNAPITLPAGDGMGEAKSHFLIEHSVSRHTGEVGGGADTVTYWLRDTALVNQDTLMVEMKTLITDTLGVLQPQTDTLEILSKTTYAKRLKEQKKKEEEWKKDVEKKLKRARSTSSGQAEPGEVVDTIMPKETLQLKYDCPSQMSPNGFISIEVPTPLERFDTAAIHLYVEQDSLWYRAPLEVDSLATGERRVTLYTDWIPGANYSFEVDSLAFIDMYGVVNAKYKAGIQVSKLEDFGSLFVNISGLPQPLAAHDTLATSGTLGTHEPSCIVQLLDGSDKVLMTAPAKKGTAEFYYIKPGTYYLRCFVDSNGNGIWDTGDYSKDLQPEEVYYNPEAVECKAKWDLTKDWNVTALPLYKQKPAAITKQKPEAEKTIKKRNLERAKNKGIELPEYLM